MLQYLPIERFLESMAASLNGPKAADARLKINVVLADLGESRVLEIESTVLHAHARPPAGDANAALTLTRPFFLRMLTGQVGALGLPTSPETKIEGSRIDLARLFALLDKPPGNSPVVTR